MREIKFRGKRKDNGEWIYGYYAPTYLFEKDGEVNNTYAILSDEIIGRTEMLGCGVLSGLPAKFIINEETLGQYTGLKDKNGKEIYEGDIVKSFQIYHYNEGYEAMTEVIGYVEWMDNRLYPFANDGEYGNWWEELTKNCEVIGNIYDNPEIAEMEA